MRNRWCLPRPWALALAILVCVPHAALADPWPFKAIRVIVPVTPGSAVDIVARIVSDRLAAQLGQPVVIENRTGAGGTIGAAAVAKADPDGHTILIHSAAHAISPSTFSNLSYDAERDYAGVMPIASKPMLLVVSPGRYTTIRDLVVAVRDRRGAINFATVGAGAAAHLTA